MTIPASFSFVPPLFLLAVAAVWIFLRSRPDLRSQANVRVVRCAALAAVLLACGQAFAWFRRAAVEAPADFRFINRGDISTLDPNRMSWMQDIRAGYALWEGLYMLDPVTLDPVLGAADKVDVSDDAIVHTFRIRSTARWSNGDPVRAGDFVFAWKRMLDLPGDYTYLLHVIRGAKEYQDAKAAGTPLDFAAVGIETPDEQTLRVTLKHPVTILPDLLAFPAFFPLHKPSMDAAGIQTGGIYDQRFTRPPHLVTNGPYRLESWEFKKKVRFVANDYYWDRDAQGRTNVKSRVIDMISAEDPMARYLIFDSGAVDWVAEVSPEIGADLLKQGSKELQTFGAFGTYFYTFNCKPTLPDGRKNPFNDVRVRQALTMALDKGPIVRNVTRMGERVATTYIPPDAFPGFRSPAGLPMDRARAKQLLAEAGYPNGQGFPAVDLLYNTGFHHGDVAQIVRRQWFEVLGIDVALAGVEGKTFSERLHNKEYAVARASWFGDYNDPSTFTDKYLSWSENNDSAWKNEEFDRLGVEGFKERDPQKRLRMFERAEQILVEEAPILPFYYYTNAYLVHQNVRGVPNHIRNMINFKSVEAVR
jgi:oligopeptide transport system substrate-binding protein